MKNPYIKVKDNNYNVYCGSQWWAITPACAKEVMEFIKNTPEIDKYFKYSFAPDELYFQTIIFNLSFKENVIKKGKPIIQDKNENSLAWAKWWANIHHIDPSLSKWYTEKDKNEIFASNKLFIRKVNTKLSSKLLDAIDDRLSIRN